MRRDITAFMSVGSVKKTTSLELRFPFVDGTLVPTRPASNL